MATKEKRVFNLKFVGIDDWNRPVFKDVDKKLYFGMTDHLFDYDTSEQAVYDYFSDDDIGRHIEFFGSEFDCEPHGGRASNWEFNFIVADN